MSYTSYIRMIINSTSIDPSIESFTGETAEIITPFIPWMNCPSRFPDVFYGKPKGGLYVYICIYIMVNKPPKYLISFQCVVYIVYTSKGCCLCHLNRSKQNKKNRYPLPSHTSSWMTLDACSPIGGPWLFPYQVC